MPAWCNNVKQIFIFSTLWLNFIPCQSRLWLWRLRASGAAALSTRLAPISEQQELNRLYSKTGIHNNVISKCENAVDSLELVLYTSQIFIKYTPNTRSECIVMDRLPVDSAHSNPHVWSAQRCSSCSCASSPRWSLSWRETEALRASLKSTLHHDLRLCSDMMRQAKHVFPAGSVDAQTRH